MNNITIKRAWEAFDEKFLKNLSMPSRIIFLFKLTFYAGCTAIMNYNLIISKSGISEEEGVEILIQLLKECDDFHKEV